MKIFNHLFNLPKSTVEASPTTESAVGKTNDSKGTTIDIDTQLENFGVDPKSELGQAMTLAAQKGVPVEAATIDEMRTFIEEVDGTTEEKLETVEKAIDKGIGVSGKTLRMLHTALHESLIPEALKPEIINLLQQGLPKSEMRQILLQVAKQLPAAENMTADQLKATVQLLVEQLDQAGVNIHELNKEPLKMLVEAFIERGITALGEDTAQMESGLATSTEALVSQPSEVTVVKSSEGSQEMPLGETMGSITDEAMLEEVHTFLESLEESVQNLVDTVKHVDSEKVINDDHIDAATSPVEVTETDVVNPEVLESAEAIFALLEDQSNTFIVREVTVKMAEVTDAFRTFKRQSVAMLNDLSKAIDEPQLMSRQEKAEQLNKVIDQVDKVLLKSDIPLYTDMKSEKKLLQFSSDLAEAKTLLQNGQQQEAKAVLDHVVKELDAMVFKPNRTKVMHVVNQKAMDQIFQSRNVQAPEMLSKGLTAFEQTPNSGRGVLEYMRQLGLNEDSEIVQKLGLTKSMPAQDQKVETQMRQILHKLSEEYEDRTRVVQAGDKMMNHLTGQQLGNKLESKSQTQNLFFNIPVVVQDEIKDLKLYVKSRKQNQKMDWENASLYFAIQTKRYDEMGIRVTSVSRNVTITVLNDHEALKTAMEPFMEAFKAEIEDVGYKVGSVNYSRLTERQEADKIEEVTTKVPVDTSAKKNEAAKDSVKKGLDVRI